MPSRPTFIMAPARHWRVFSRTKPIATRAAQDVLDDAAREALVQFLISIDVQTEPISP